MLGVLQPSEELFDMYPILANLATIDKDHGNFLTVLAREGGMLGDVNFTQRKCIRGLQGPEEALGIFA
jgi:hypothetical protein